MVTLKRLVLMVMFSFASLIVTAQSVAAQAAPRTSSTFTCSTGNCVPEAPVAIILPFVSVLALGIVWFAMARTRRSNRLPDAQ